MPPHRPPDDVRRLLDERGEARAARDWSRADALRDRIASLGWEVQDGAGRLHRPTAAARRARGDRLRGSRRPGFVLDEPATVAASVQVVADDHGDDLQRALAASQRIRRRSDGSWWSSRMRRASSSTALFPMTCQWPRSCSVRERRLGWADARTLGLRRSRGEVTIMLDTSRRADR